MDYSFVGMEYYIGGVEEIKPAQVVTLTNCRISAELMRCLKYDIRSDLMRDKEIVFEMEKSLLCVISFLIPCG